jgi:uncharacterized Zn finger protein
MTALPQLTEDDIRRWTDGGSLGRGGRFFSEGHTLNPRRQGSRLRARCTGSRPQPYHVAIDLGPQGILSGECSCPVGSSGHRKHAAALPEHSPAVPRLRRSSSRRLPHV